MTQPKADPREALAIAQADPVTMAREVLLKAMLGQLDLRTQEAQRRAANDVLNGALRSSLASATDDELLAECIKRGLRLPVVDLDAAEAEVTRGKP